jgi:hypothetical protein
MAAKQRIIIILVLTSNTTILVKFLLLVYHIFTLLDQAIGTVTVAVPDYSVARMPAQNCH